MKPCNIFTAALIGIIPLMNCARVTDIVGDLFVSEEQEIKMGEDFHSQEILANPAKYPIDTVSAQSRYIDSLGRALLPHQQRDGLEYHFYVITDTVINAFALPGGYVYMYQGLLKNADTETEIQAVLAHEIGHVAKRHTVDALVKAYGRNMVLDFLLGENSAIIGQITNLALDLKNSRDMEYQADSCAIAYMSLSGNNPVGMKTFLEKLMAMNTGMKMPDFLSTHPSDANRITAIQKIVGETPVYEAASARPLIAKKLTF